MRFVSFFLLAVACTMVAQQANAQQELSEHDGRAMVAMSACRTTGCVRKVYATISRQEIVARVGYYSKLLALQPDSKPAACGLLRSIPRTEDEDIEQLNTSLYPGESYAEIVATGRAFRKFNRNLAHALKLCPQYLPQFIKYGTIALSPTNSYPNWAARVCRSNPKRFLQAFRTLSAKDQEYIADVVIRPKDCKQIAFPEVP